MAHTRAISLGAAAALILVVTASCSGIEKSTEPLPRPDVLLVDDFAVSTREPRSEAARVVGRKFADALASSLVEEIRKMGLPAARASSDLPPDSTVVAIQGRFIPAYGDAPPPGVIFPAGWPDVIAAVQIYGITSEGERLSQDLSFNLAAANLPIPANVVSTPSTASDEVGPREAGILPAVAADIETAGKEGGATVAKQLEPFFIDNGWIAARADS